MKRSRKGNVGAWGAIGIGIVGILMIWAVSAITLQAFRDSQLTNTAGCNATATTACGVAYNTTNLGLSFMSNASSQLGTAGTILGVSLLLVIVGAVGIGAYAGYQRLRG